MRTQEESVYNLIPRPAEEIVKNAMYRSKHDPTLPPSCSTLGLKGTSKLASNYSGVDNAIPNKRDAATFGKEVMPTIDPQSFLKKSLSGSKKVAAASSQSAARALASVRPPVPRRDERPVMGLVTDKNFVVSNAVENILAVPKRTHSEPPLPTQSKTFGRVPPYLQKIKSDISEEKTYLQQLSKQRASGERDHMRAMTEEEKAELIAGLKRKWHDTHKQYQMMPFTLDSVAKIQRKEALEVEMEQIEKAIEKLSKKNIHVYDDSELW